MTNHVNQLTHAERTLVEGSADFNDDQWLLFHTDTDFAEVHDLAGLTPSDSNISSNAGMHLRCRTRSCQSTTGTIASPTCTRHGFNSAVTMNSPQATNSTRFKHQCGSVDSAWPQPSVHP